MSLLFDTPISETSPISVVNDLSIEEMAKQIQQLTDESAKINETLTKLKQALIGKLA